MARYGEKPGNYGQAEAAAWRRQSNREGIHL